MYFADEDANGNDLAAYWQMVDGTGIDGNRGMLYVRGAVSGTMNIFRVTGATARAGETELAVSHVAGGTRPADDAMLAVSFTPAGPSPIRVLTQAQYDALSTKDPATFYYIT